MGGHVEDAPVALRLGDGLTLPAEAVTETFAILAKRGSGKTYTAAVMVEELLDAQQPVVVVDPVGVWWGLRSSADGKGDGYPVVIFGGDHADVPLEETAGTLIADVIVDERISVVLDLSAFSKSASRRFMTDFLERLYHRNRDPLHVVVDEADAFAPQRTPKGGERLLGAMEDLVRRGRARGVGVTLITQRPAVLNKDVLTQAEVLIVLRMTGPRDVAAVDEWVQLHADADEARAVKRSLAALPVGTAWVWSPGWLGLLRQVRVRRRRTFDSSATPTAGRRRSAPRRMADVDLAALGERIAATVEKARSEDPRALRARIAELERQLEAALQQPAPEPVEVVVEVPVLAPELVDQIEAALTPAATLLGEAQETLAKHRQWAERQLDAARTVVHARPVETPAARQQCPRPQPGPAPAVGVSPDAPQVKKGARRILETLARHYPMRMTRAQLGTLAHFKITGGTFQTYWSQLRRAGLVDESGGDVGITDAGLAYIGAVPTQPMTTEEVLEQWRTALKAGARAMLDVLVDAYPRALTRQELADAVGMAVSGGTFGTYLSTLRRNGLVDVDGDMVRAGDALFLGERRFKEAGSS